MGKKLLVARHLTSSNKKLLVAPGITTSNKKLVERGVDWLRRFASQARDGGSFVDWVTFTVSGSEREHPSCKYLTHSWVWMLSEYPTTMCALPYLLTANTWPA